VHTIFVPWLSENRLEPWTSVVLAIRTWAVWNLNKVVGVGLIALMLAYLVIQCILLYGLMHSTPSYCRSEVLRHRLPFDRIACVVGFPAVGWQEYVALAAIESSAS
jgi:hypothetical protein